MIGTPVTICGLQSLLPLVSVSAFAPALDAGDFFFQHMMIEGYTDLFDMPRLFFAENISRSADVHIVTGQREPGTQTVQRLQNAQTPLGNRLQIFSAAP